MKSYKIKEIYYTLQGEGAQSGRAAVFCRFTGCNLWSGREADRKKAICQFCDTDFADTKGINGGTFSAMELAMKVADVWKGKKATGRPLVVCTGGEPLLQLDEALINGFHDYGFQVAVETNGTKPIPKGIDWVCVSPKANTQVVVNQGHELKLVFPQPGAEPERFEAWEFDHFFLQPMDGPLLSQNTKAAIAYCLENPQWKLSLQTHKLIGIP